MIEERRTSEIPAGGRSCCRPGGIQLTERLLSWVERYRRPAMERALRVLDIGCGEGATIRYLEENYPQWKPAGIDPVLPGDGGRNLTRGRAEHLPYPDHSVDLVFMECTFSRVQDPVRALSEIRRVLAPEGKLLISDLYRRLREEWSRIPGEPEVLTGDEPDGPAGEGIAPSDEPAPAGMPAARQAVGRLETAEVIYGRLREAGFNVLEMQDVSRVLGDWIAQMIMDGEEDPAEVLGMAPAELRKQNCGYYLCAAEISPLRDTVRYAGEHSEFYRGKLREITAGDEKDITFSDLTLTSPEDIREDPEAFLCVSPKEIARVITLQTSGTSGRPKRLFFTEEDMRRTADFFSWGIRFLVRPGDRVAVFMEGPAHYSVGGLLREGLAGLPAETEVFGFIRDYPEAASRAEGRDSLIGVPSQMYRLACAAPQLRPRTVLLSADYVPESVTRFLEERWKCKVFTHWGMSETGYGGGVQCEAGEGYHLREDLLVEITDPHSGRPLPPGAWGEVTVTTMRRAGMPLIRYRTGDLGRLLTAPCPCGCLKPRLDKVMGRIGEGIRLDGGAVITIQMLDEELLQIPGIREYEVCWRPESRRLEFVIDTGAEAGGGSARRDPDKSEASGSPDSGEEPAGNEKIGEEVRRVVREMSGGTVSAEISYGGVHGSGGNLKRKIKYVPG